MMMVMMMMMMTTTEMCNSNTGSWLPELVLRYIYKRVGRLLVF
jgi:hypothetical protein